LHKPRSLKAVESPPQARRTRIGHPLFLAQRFQTAPDVADPDPTYRRELIQRFEEEAVEHFRTGATPGARPRDPNVGDEDL